VEKNANEIRGAWSYPNMTGAPGRDGTEEDGMRRLGTTLIGLFMLGCPPQLDDPEHDGEPADLPSDTADPGEDGETSLLGPELQGLGIVEEEDGPWTIRRSDRGRTERSDKDGAFEDSSVEMEPAMPTSVATDSAAPEPGRTYRGGGLAGLGSAGGRGDAATGAPAELAVVERKKGRADVAQSGAPMRAGSTDDNADFDDFLAFLAGWSDDAHVASQWDELDVRDRRQLRITDGRGNPAPGVQVALIDEVRDAVVWSATTYGDGSLPFYPSVASRELGESGSLAAPQGGFLVQVSHGDQQTVERWNGIGDELVVEIGERQKVPATIPLDVCFLIDTTGSMGDEISRIKATLLRVTERLRGLEQEFDLHYSAVLYRDIGDEYVTKAHPFTGDIESFVDTLQGVQANGGGDGPESLNQGLAHAVSLDGWRDGAAKVMFLIADAPPHMDYSGDTPYGQSLLAAVDRGIRIHSVAASGLDSFGTVVMRQTAQFTGGKFIFVEYGSTAASAASHGVTGSVSSNNLDDIIYQQISGELAGWGQPTAAVASR